MVEYQIKTTLKLLAVVGWLMLLTALPIQAWADGKSLFEVKCITCHTLPDPDNLTADMWVPLIERMSVMANLKPDEKTEVLGYLQANSGTLENILAEEREHFNQHCSGCHATEDKVPKTEKAGAQYEEYMIEHVEEKTGNELDEKMVHEVAEFLLHVTLRK